MQGYQDDDIAFYSPVTFVAGVDGTPTLGNVEYAVQDWAALNTQDLVVYLMGGKAGGSFVLDGADRLSGRKLDAFITTLQGKLPGVKVLVVWDGSRSGGFLTALAGPERIVISSSGSDSGGAFRQRR